MKKDYPLLILLWMAALLTFAVTKAPGGLDVDSCNYAVVAKEILRTGHWLKLYDPVYQGVFYYHFPLCIWVTAVFFKLFGVAAFSAKLFAMLCNLGLVAAVYYFGKAIRNAWTGFFAGLCFLMTNHVIRLAMQCRMDIPVSLFITLAIFSFVLVQKYSRLYYLCFGLFTALAIFAKDITGTAPLAIVFLYLLLRFKWKEFFRPLFIAGLVVAVAPVLFWIWLDGQTLLKYWWSWNFLHLLKSPSFTVPWYYYLLAILNKYFYFLPFAIYGGYLGIKEAAKRKGDELLLLVIWAVFFPLVFSFGRQKLHYFILPMYPATSLLAGAAFDKILKDSLKPKIVAVLKYILIIASLILLCLPLDIRSRRFAPAVKLMPVVDQVLKEVPDYEFIVYKYDTAAILFYSQQLTRLHAFSDQAALEKALAQDKTKPRFCFISTEDFSGLAPSIKDNYTAILKYQDKLILASEGNNLPVVCLPE